MFSILGFLTCKSKLPMNYKHLSQTERYQIYALMKAGHDQTQIARLLDRSKSTISRELVRNRGSKGYRPKQACELAHSRSALSRNASTVAPLVREQVCQLLQLQWSPEQIASQLPLSHETIYLSTGVCRQGSRRLALEEPAEPETKKETLCQWSRQAGPYP